MIQKECSYCGAFASSYLENCEICGSTFPFENVSEKETDAFNKRKSDAYSEKTRMNEKSDLPNFSSQKKNREYKCTICGKAALFGRSRCSECVNSTVRNTKNGFETSRTMIALIVFGAISILGVMTYFYLGISEATPDYMLKKYEEATGINKSLTYKNYVLKGKGVMTLGFNGRQKTTKDFLYIITFEKPNKFSMEYWAYDSKQPTIPSRLILKQVYNGLTHRQYDNFAGELSGQNSAGKITELSDEESVINEMGLSFGNAANYEMTENSECTGLNKPTCDFVAGSKLYKVEGQNIEIKPSRKLSLRVNQKPGGTVGKNILEFDGDNGFLLRNIRELKTGGMTQYMEMSFDEYKKFQAPSKNFFGAEQTTEILMPTKSKITSTIGPDFEMKINMNMESLEFNQKIDENIYDLPSAK